MAFGTWVSAEGCVQTDHKIARLVDLRRKFLLGEELFYPCNELEDISSTDVASSMGLPANKRCSRCSVARADHLSFTDGRADDEAKHTTIGSSAVAAQAGSKQIMGRKGETGPTYDRVSVASTIRMKLSICQH